MKKIISSIMSAAMIAGMSSTAFASKIPDISVDRDSKFYFEKEGILYEIKEDEILEPGEKLYIEISSDDEMITAFGAKHYKAVSSWINGEEIFEKAVLESKKKAEKTEKLVIEKGKKAPYNLKENYKNIESLINDLNLVVIHDKSCETENCEDISHILHLTNEEKAEAIELYTEVYTYNYNYFVTIYTKKNYDTKPIDLVGEIKLVKKQRNNPDDISTVSVNRTFGYKTDFAEGIRHKINNNKPVVNFSKVKGEIEIEISDDIEFEVDAENQKDLFMGYNTNANFEIIDQNPDANIRFLNFIGKPEFNNSGKMRVYSEKTDLYVYEIVNNGIKLIKAKYDDYEAYVFETRKLGSYLFSDKDIKFTSLD